MNFMETGCPHCRLKDRDLERLYDRVDELEEQLHIKMPTRIVPPAFRKIKDGRPAIWKLLRYLVEKREMVKEQAYFALYRDVEVDDRPELKTLDVHMSKLRGILRRYGIELGTYWGVGWYLSPDDQAKARALVESFINESHLEAAE